MKTTFPKCTKVVSRKQYRYLKLCLDSLGDAETAKWCEYTKTELIALLAVDYDSLPERTSDPKATPRDKNGLAQAECACGCGTLFVSKNKQHKYAAPSHRGRQHAPKVVLKPAPKSYAWVLDMRILVDPAMDHYETRVL